MIHSITITHGLHTYVYRFTPQTIPDLRFRLALDAERGNFPYDLAFEANRQVQTFVTTGTEMEEIEKLRTEWQRLGFNLQINANSDGWTCLLWNGITHRPPHGSGPTLFKAMAMAELDRLELMKTAKQRA